MNTLRVRMPPLADLGAESGLDFEIIDGERRVLQRGIAVPGALPRIARVELVIAAPDVIMIDAALPRLSGARLRAALPALAEPILLGDIEQAFVVASRPDAAGRATLAVLDRALLQRALGLFARLGITPVSATPEPLTLAAAPGRWRLRLGSAYGSLRMGERLGIVCSDTAGSEPPVELRLALEQAGAARPEAIEVEGACDAVAWTEALGVKVTTTAPDLGRAAPVTLELLQYDLAPRIVDWRAWRVPAALGVALTLAWIAGLNIDAWLKQREAQQLRGQMNAVFRETFPKVPVVLDPRVGSSLLGHLSGAISGGAITRKTSFLLDAMGTRIFAPGIRIQDDPHRPRGLRSRPFDGEGLPVSPIALVEDGKLETWLLDSATARQLGLEPTGHASRGIGGAPGVGPSNLFLENGKLPVETLIADISYGVYVTELIGQGVNIVTGDYSRGAAGFLIENGEITRPVSEFTVAGTLQSMFRELVPANDLEFRYGINVPTLRIDGMTVASG